MELYLLEMLNLSRLVREWLRRFNLYEQTSHEDRIAVDNEIEARKGVNCDEAMADGRVSDSEFLEIVNLILRRRKQRMLQLEMVI